MSNSEAEFAAWWAAGHAVGHDLRTADHRTARVLFAGRPGGGAGPDFRDAVILLDGARVVGDVELHLRAAGWHAHGHDADPRYDRVILHAIAGGRLPLDARTRLASGASAPSVLLAHWRDLAAAPSPWPCQEQAMTWEPALRRWGAERFARKAARFRAELAAPGATLDGALLAGIAAALGYGRLAPPLTPPHASVERGTKASVERGTRLNSPSPLGALADNGEGAGGWGRDQLTARRVQAMAATVARWQVCAGAECCGALLAGGEAAGWERLVALFAAVGRARAGIVVWNAVLPCLAAYGDERRNLALSRLARQVAATAPGLPSNAITRAMGRWLGLGRLPAGALAQQGLHHLHAQWCRVKDCAACPARR